MSLNRRLCRLERIRRGCPACGQGPGGSFAEGYEVVWDDGGEPPPEDAEPEFCPACGRQTSYTVGGPRRRRPGGGG